MIKILRKKIFCIKRIINKMYSYVIMKAKIIYNFEYLDMFKHNLSSFKIFK